MTSFAGVLLIFLVVLTVPIIVAFVVGLVRVGAARRRLSGRHEGPAPVLLEILVPVKGVVPDQELMLNSLLEQDYPNYGVIFILESERDPANALIDKLCDRCPIARKAISGMSNTCAQKNHNLVKGIAELRSETEIVVFCDSTNAAEPDWLKNFTAPLRAGEGEVVSTFRAFAPDPENLSGVCQAIYASFVLPLAISKPKPWGGATGIRRKTLESLNVAEAWSRTVVDDLVLGNILDRAGVKVLLDPVHLLRSPLKNQTFRGLVSYLDRQILFPKFTNPWIWITFLVSAVSLTGAAFLAAVNAVLFPMCYVESLVGWLSWGFLGASVFIVLQLRRSYPVPISWKKWMAAFFPTICLMCFLFVRSIFLDHVDWHGRRYYTGKGGVVLCTGFESGAERVGS